MRKIRSEIKNETNTLMIRYGELSTKGKNINLFIDRLGRNVKNALEDSYPNVEISWFRIECMWN